MSYDVYFANLTEENKSLLLTLLRLKEEAGMLEQEERALLAQFRGQAPAPSDRKNSAPPAEIPLPEALPIQEPPNQEPEPE